MHDIPHFLDTEIPILASQFGCRRECFTSFIGSSLNIIVILQQPMLYSILILSFYVSASEQTSSSLPERTSVGRGWKRRVPVCIGHLVFSCEGLVKLSHRSEVSQQHGSPPRLIAHCEGFSDPCQAPGVREPVHQPKHCSRLNCVCLKLRGIKARTNISPGEPISF